MKTATDERCTGSYGNLESTCYTLLVRLTDRLKTLYRYCFKDFSLI